MYYTKDELSNVGVSMNIEKAIKLNKYFLIVQVLSFIIDIVLSIIFDINVYFIFMWIIGVIVVLYDGFMGTYITRRIIYKKPNYSSIMKNYPYAFTDIRIIISAIRTNDFEVKTFLSQQFLSIGIFILNIFYVIIITVILHPEHFG